MVAAAAREIHDREVVFTGMRLPLIAFALAKESHAPHAVGLFESGIMRDTPAHQLLYTMCDPPNITGALWATRMINLMGLLAQGCVDLGFIGGAEVDRFGNLNTSYLGNYKSPTTKLPGSGGAADIASLSKRLVVVMAHEKRRLVERVNYITSVGNGAGGDWRFRSGLARGGPSALITTLGVLGFEEKTGEAFLRSYHPGQTVESVRAETGWDLKIAPDVRETAAPTPRELEIMRRYDPQGFWTK
jgi:glutaconate CoA-transferase, subunit B